VFQTDEWCVRAMTSSDHVTTAVYPGLPLVAENENQTEVEERPEITGNMTLSSVESNEVKDNPPGDLSLVSQ